MPHAARRVALALATCTATSGTAAQENLEQRLLEAAAFVAEATGAPVPVVHLRRARASELQGAGFGEGAAHGHQAADVAAAFYPANAEIAIAADLEVTNDLGLSFLVHELVHAQQFAAGRQAGVRCLGELEREAYAIQARFLRARLRRDDAFFFDLVGLMQVSCDDYR